MEKRLRTLELNKEFINIIKITFFFHMNWVISSFFFFWIGCHFKLIGDEGIPDWIWKLRGVCYCYLNSSFQYLNNITHFFTLYIFLQNNINITRNILLGLKWLKIAFHLEPSFSLVLMWMQHTRQIINRKVNRSPSQIQLISQFCAFFLSSMNLLENSSTKKKRKICWRITKVSFEVLSKYKSVYESLTRILIIVSLSL